MTQAKKKSNSPYDMIEEMYSLHHSILKVDCSLRDEVYSEFLAIITAHHFTKLIQRKGHSAGFEAYWQLKKRMDSILTDLFYKEDDIRSFHTENLHSYFWPVGHSKSCPACKVAS